MITDTGILFIEPQGPPSSEPLIDDLTIKMADALRKAETGTWRNGHLHPGGGYRGVHQCGCGARSSNRDHVLASGELTNSLATHYLAYHRSDIPDDQLEKVRRLPETDPRPSITELVPPPRR